MAMHTRKTYQRDSGRFSVKRRALLRLRTEKRAEGLSGGAGKGCYGKSVKCILANVAKRPGI